MSHTKSGSATDHKWWKEAVVYQVYWRSFYDTDGDGYGDLEGVLAKLDYIQTLGANVIWLNPCYASPDVDNGYDIADYLTVTPKAGSMDTWEKLVAEVHRRGLKLIMDMVVNHTSDQHPWFTASRASRSNPFRDYYIWRSQPNNWRSYFSPSAWTLDPVTGDYYFHSFAAQQPDLNWENPRLRHDIYGMMNTWLDKGIDGFRLDAINLLAKEAGFPDAPNPDDIRYLGNQPMVHEYLREMHDHVFRGRNILTVGEIPFVSPADGRLYVDEARSELDTLFHFQVLDDMPTWDLPRFKRIQQSWYSELWGKGWNSQFLNNHDHTRLVSRYGDEGRYRIESATCFATMIHTLPGTPYIYQGEEIGMTGVRFDSIDDYQDVAFRNRYEEEIANGVAPEQAWNALLPLARDNSRTPMQWDDTHNAGFTQGTPWMKVNPNYKRINVASDVQSPVSIYKYYQDLIRLRRRHPALIYGDYVVIEEAHTQVYAYVRRRGGEQLFVLMNICSIQAGVEIPVDILKAELLLSNYPVRGNLQRRVELEPYEARIYQLTQNATLR